MNYYGTQWQAFTESFFHLIYRLKRRISVFVDHIFWDELFRILYLLIFSFYSSIIKIFTVMNMQNLLIVSKKNVGNMYWLWSRKFLFQIWVNMIFPRRISQNFSHFLFFIFQFLISYWCKILLLNIKISRNLKKTFPFLLSVSFPSLSPIFAIPSPFSPPPTLLSWFFPVLICYKSLETCFAREEVAKSADKFRWFVRRVPCDTL